MKPILSKPLAAISMSAIAFAVLLSLAPSGALAQDRTAPSEESEAPRQSSYDLSTTAKVKAELGKDEAANARQVTVTTFDGVVRLSGFISTEEEKEQVERAAKSVSGVRGVENRLIVQN
jgi:hyperosmotically inducible protein